MRVFHKSLNVAGDRPRAAVKKRRPFTEGEGQALAMRLDTVGMMLSLEGVHTSSPL